MDTVGWASRHNTFAARRGSFFRKRRLASELVEVSQEESFPMSLADLSTLTLSEDGGGIQKRSTSVTSTTSTTRSQSETTVLSSEEGNGSTDFSSAGQPRPPRPSKPSQRAMIRHTPAVPTQARIDELFAHERSCFDAVKMQWQAFEDQMEMQRHATYSGHGRRKKSGGWSNSSSGDANIARLSDEQYLHFVRAAGYDVGATLTFLHDCKRAIGLTCLRMESQLRTKTLFAVPGLQSREGFDVFYMRPSRYFPKQTKTSVVIDNLLYVMKALVERKRSSTDGIAFMANMSGWEMSNFSMNYCLQFMKTLQGENFPVEVRRFLIVDPPSWFDKIWRIMKSMLSADFQKRVHIIPNSQLDVYLGDGYPACLPDDIVGGQNPTDEMIEDFIEYRKHVEYTSQYGEEEKEGDNGNDEREVDNLP